jgi:glycosyltransferase involved in cell wall biosynthesis
MKVAVAVLGRFHAFDLARELQTRGALARLISSYPRRSFARFGLDPARCTGLGSLEVLHRLWQRAPRAWHQWGDGRLHGHFAARVGRELPPSLDVFVGWSGATLEAIPAARAAGARVVLERGSAHIDTQTELLREAYAELRLPPRLPERRTIERERAEYEQCDAVAVPSEFAAQTFRARGFPEQRLIVNPYGVDLRQFAPAERRPPGFRVLFAGTASVQKGTHDLVRAFERAALPGAELWLVGRVEPALRPWLEGRHGVRLHGPVPQAQLPELYRSAHLFALPSRQDGFGLVLTQAMACGLPVLASTHTGAPGLVRPGFEGRLVEPGDVHALAEGLAFYAEHADEAWRQGRRAAARVAAGYGWSDYGERALAAYGALLGDRAGAAALRSPSHLERAG